MRCRSAIFGVVTNDVLIAIPLFVFMGVMLERSRVAEDLLETMGRLLGSVTGGLAIAVVIVGVLLAAAKGIVGATTVTMGLIVLPVMLRHGYDPRLAAGTVAATATLAQIFPPATVLVLLGDQMSNAYQAAQLSQGVFSPQSVTVTDLFAGAIIPAFGLVALYLMFLIGVAAIWPKTSPAVPPQTGAPHGFALARRLVAVLVAPLALILRGAGLDPRRHRDAIGVGVDRRRRRDHAGCGPLGRDGLHGHGAGGGAAQDRADRQHDLSHPDRRDPVQSRVPRLRRRRHGASRADRSAGRHGRRGAGGDAGDVSARLCDGCLRDYFRGGADRRAGRC